MRALRRQPRTDVLDQFLFGLKDPLDHQMRYRFLKDLNAAIAAAIEFEGKQSGRNLDNTTPAPGKASAQVRRAMAEEAQPGSSEQNRAKNSQSPKPAQGVNPLAHCSYCSQPGHAVDYCKILIRHASQHIFKNW